MLVPVLQPIPVVEDLARNFKSIFANQPEYEQFKNYLSGLVVVEKKNFSQIANHIIKSADKTNISRFMNNELWSGEELNDKRVKLIYERTKQYDSKKPGYLIFDDTLDEHVGTMFEHIARYYDHCDGSYKLAQNPVTSHYVRGRISFPVAFRSYHSYDKVTDWAEHFSKNFPEIKIPSESKQRNKLKKKYEEQLLNKDQEFAAKHKAFKTKITLACELVEDAVRRGLEFSVVLFDAWYLAPELVEVIEKRHKAWISILKPNRKLQANSLRIYDAAGNKMKT
jgi:SRSO17 transposase